MNKIFVRRRNERPNNIVTYLYPHANLLLQWAVLISVRSVSSQTIHKYYLKVTWHIRAVFKPNVHYMIWKSIHFSSIQFHAITAQV